MMWFLFIWFYLIISSQTNNIYITIFFIFIYVIFDFNDSFYCNLIKLEYSVFILIIFFLNFLSFSKRLRTYFQNFWQSSDIHLSQLVERVSLKFGYLARPRKVLILSLLASFNWLLKDETWTEELDEGLDPLTAKSALWNRCSDRNFHS